MCPKMSVSPPQRSIKGTFFSIVRHTVSKTCIFAYSETAHSPAASDTNMKSTTVLGFGNIHHLKKTSSLYNLQFSFAIYKTRN